MTDELKILYKKMADHTRPVCMGDTSKDLPLLEKLRGGECMTPGSCCSPEYCDFAMERAAELGEPIEPTGHQRLPMMGPNGCVAPPHVRPMCTLHVCCINGAGFKSGDPTWTREYFDLRAQIEKKEYAEQRH